MSSDDGTLTFRPARRTDKDAILRMRRRATGEEQDPALWDWLFEQNTSDSRLYGYVAESDGLIVSQHATLPVRLSHAGRHPQRAY